MQDENIVFLEGESPLEQIARLETSSSVATWQTRKERVSSPACASSTEAVWMLVQISTTQPNCDHRACLGGCGEGAR